MKIALINKLFKGVVEAVKFVTTNGTSSDFVKGDGTLDSTEYSPSTHTHTLQEVTDEGATTTKAVNLGSGSQIGSDDYGHLRLGGTNCEMEYDWDSLRFTIGKQDGNYTSLMIDSPSDSNNHSIYAPKNKSGTLALIEDLQNIDDIEIGGRNYTLNTSNDWIDVSLTTGHHNIELIDPTVPNSGKYTASIIVKDTGGARYQIRFRQYTSTGNSFLASSSWTDEGERAVVTHDFSINEVDDYTILQLAIRLESGSSNGKYKELKLEKGNVATDWTPAPEDQVTDWDETNPDSFAFLKNKPATFPPSEHTHTFTSLTSKPTTIGGYGITDFNSLGDARWALRTRTITGTGSLTGGGNLTANRTLDLTTTAKSDIAKGVTAHGWGNHALEGYLTSFTETDPTVPSHVKAITTGNITNWNTAFGWGNHAGLYAPTSRTIKAGTGLSGGGTLAADRTFNVNFGTTAGTVMEGDDNRIVDGGVLRTIVSLDSNFDIDTLKNPEHVGLYEGEFNFPVLGNVIGGGGGDKRGVLEVVEVSGTIMHILKTLKGDVYTRFYEFGAWSTWRLSATQEWTINNFPTFSDLYGVNTVMEGGYYLIPGEAYKYSVWASKYVINGLLYNERIEGEVTLSQAHPTLNRFDLIVVTTDEEEPFKVIEGVPAENPVRPNFDTGSEVDLTFIYVNSVSDGGGQVGNYLLVYDENLGHPNEANTSAVDTSSGSFPPIDIDFENTEQAYSGKNSIKVISRGGNSAGDPSAYISFELNKPFNRDDFDKFVFHFYSDTAVKSIYNIWFIGADDQIAAHKEFTALDSRGYGNFESNVWNQIVIPLDDFTIINENSYNGDIKEVRIRAYSASYAMIYLDYIFLTSDTGTGIGGGQNLIERTSQIPINDGATGVSRYAEMRDLPTKTSDLINDGEDGQSPFISYSDIYTENQIINSSVINVPNTLTYRVSVFEYIIDGVFYNTPVIDNNIVLSPIAGNNRIDVIALDFSDPLNHEIVVVAGTPAQSPAKPNIDSETQLEITFVIVSDGKSSPSGVRTKIIYNENLQIAGGEANTYTPRPQDIDFNDTSNAYVGSKSIKAINHDDLNSIDRYMEFELDEVFYNEEFDKLVLHSYVPSGQPGGYTNYLLDLEFISPSGIVSAVNNIVPIDTFIEDEWVTYTAEHSQLNIVNQNAYEEGVKKIRIRMGKGYGVYIYIDYIFFQGGVAIPTQSMHNNLQGLQGGIAYPIVGVGEGGEFGGHKEYYHLSKRDYEFVRFLNGKNTGKVLMLPYPSECIVPGKHLPKNVISDKAEMCVLATLENLHQEMTVTNLHTSPITYSISMPYVYEYLFDGDTGMRVVTMPARSWAKLLVMRIDGTSDVYYLITAKGDL